VILALDIATTTGWAFGSLGQKPFHGVIRTQGGIGEKLASFSNILEELIRSYDPDLIVIEQPLHSIPRAGSSKSLRLLLGLCAMAECVGHWHNIPVREVPMATWRKHFIGAGRAPKGEPRDWCKRQAMHRCEVLGWGEMSDDEAEACGILDYALSLRNSKAA